MTALEKYRKTLLNYKKNKLRNLNKYTDANLIIFLSHNAIIVLNLAKTCIGL